MANNYYNFPVPFIAGTKVRSDQVNTQYQGIESGFDLLSTDPAASIIGTTFFGTDVQGATVNEYLITTPDPNTPLVNGQRVSFFATHSNDGAVTLNVDSSGLVAGVNLDGDSVVSGQIVSGQFYEWVYDNANTQWLVTKGLTGITDPLLLSNGSVGAPTYSFELDPDTGMFQNGANILGFAAGGFLPVQVDASNGAGNLQLILSPGGPQATATFPSLAFGDGDTGLHEPSDDQLAVSLGGVNKFFWAGDVYGSLTGAGPAMLNEAASSTNPTLVPDRSDIDTGLGQNASGEPSLIGNGVELARGVAAGSGGLQANNTLTGGGLERVLTVSDAFTGTIASPIRVLTDINTLTPPTTEAVTGAYEIWDADDTDILQRLGFEGSNELQLRNFMHGGSVTISGENAAGVTTLLVRGDPDGITELFAAGVCRFEAQSLGKIAVRSDGNTDTEDRQLVFDHQDTSDRGRIGYIGDDILLVKNEIHGGNVKLQAEDTGGVVRQILEGDPDASTVVRGDTTVRLQHSAGTLGVEVGTSVDLYESGVLVAQTLGAAAGGLQANNTLTGAGLERVLTTGDIPGGGVGDVTKVGTPVDNEIGVWTGDGTIEGDANFTWDGSVLDIVAGDIQMASAGQIFGGSGTALAPAIAVRQINMGMYSDVATILKFATGNAEQFRMQDTVTEVFSDSFRLRPDIGGDSFFMQVGVADLLLATTGMVDVDWEGVGGERFKLREFNLAMLEKATVAVPADEVGYGQFWVRDDVPNTPMFRDDAGTDFVLNAAGGGGDVTKVGTPVDDQIGVWTGDGTIEGTTGLTWDGSEVKAEGSQAGFIADESDGGGASFFRATSTSTGDSGIQLEFDSTSGVNARIRQVTPGGSLEDIWISFAENAGVGIRHNNIQKLLTIASGVQFDDSIYVIEKVAANADIATQGQFWVRDDAPGQTPMWTDDAGTDFVLNTAGGGGDVTKVGTPVDNQVGVWTGDGTIEGTTGLTYNGSAFEVAGSIQVANGSGGLLVNEAGSATNPTLIPRKGDLDTGISTVADDRLGLVAGGELGMVLVGAGGGVIHAFDTDATVTAFAGGGQGSATQLNQSYNIVTTVATTGDSVKLPPINHVGGLVYIKNDGVNACDVFPASGDDLGQGVGVALSVSAGAAVTFMHSVSNTTWTQIQFEEIAGTGNVVKVGTPVNNEIGVWTGDGTIEGDANFTWDGAQLLLPQADVPAAPTLAFGDGATGFYEEVDNTIAVSLGGNKEFEFSPVGDPDFSSVELLSDNDGADGATTYTERSLNAASATFVGNAQLDTAQFKFGTASMLFDGTGDYASYPDDASLELGSGAFTIEGWVRFNTLPVNGERMSLISQWEGVGSDRAYSLWIEKHAVFDFTIQFEWNDNVDGNIESGSIDPVDPVVDTWFHFAVIRSADDALYMWWDGAREFNSAPGAFDGAIDNSTVPVKLGVRDPNDVGDEQFLDGWLDDVRITVGVERYDTSGDFTPPTAAFPTNSGQFTGNEVGSGKLFNQVASFTSPTLVPRNDDDDTGIGGDGSDAIAVIAGGIEGVRFTELNDAVIPAYDAALTVTAFATGGQGSATQLDNGYNVLGTVATAGDSVKLPPVFAANSVVYIKNDGAAAADVFPATGDDLGAGTNIAVSVSAGGSLTFIATVADSTWTQLIVDTTNVVSGGLLTAEYRFSTTITASDPGPGRFRYNNATPASVTAVFIDDFTNAGIDISNLLGLITTGDRLYFQTESDGSEFLVFNVSAPITDNTGWFTITGTVEASGNLHGNNDACLAALQIGGAGSAGDVFKVGTPVDDQVGVWTGDGTIEGTTGLTYNGSTFNVSGDITLTGTVDGIDIATDVAANTAKVTNATHTGQVTGATALALDVTAITAQPASGAIAAADTILTNDGGVLSESTFTQMITFFDANLSFGGGDVTKVGTPVNNQVGVWTGDGTLEGDTNFQFDGSQLLLLNGTAALPAYAFVGDPDTGMYHFNTNTIGLATGGVARFVINASELAAVVAGGALMRNNVAPSATVPVFIPNGLDVNTGLGHNAADQLSLVAGGVEMLRAIEAGTSATDQIFLPRDGAEATPALALGALDRGWWSAGVAQINASIGGTRVQFFNSSSFTQFGSIGCGDASSARLLNEVASATNPTVIPNQTDPDTGIGWNAANELSLVTGGLERMTLAVGGVEIFANAIVSGDVRATGANAYELLNEAATATNPTLLPNRADSDTGIGGVAGVLSLIHNGAESAHTITPATGGLEVNNLSTGAGLERVLTTADLSVASAANDAVQARRTTSFTIIASFVDVTLDATDVETDAAVIEHDNTNTDDIDVKVTGTYKIAYELDVDNTLTTGSDLVLVQARVRLNDLGTGINGSISNTSAFRDTSVGTGAEGRLNTHLSNEFIVDLTANDFVTLQLNQIPDGGLEVFTAENVSLQVTRLL